MIEILIVVAIIAILVLLLLPSLLTAIQKTKQKETMGSIVSIATACAHYITDTGYAPLKGAHAGEIQDNGDLVKVLAPTYIKTCPTSDEWGNRLLAYMGSAVSSVYEIPEDVIGDDDFLIVSLGRDGMDGGSVTFTYNPNDMLGGLYSMGELEDFNNDLINLNGTWIHAPVSYKKD